MSNKQLDKRPASLREKLAQLLFIRIGSNMSPPRNVEEDASCVAELIGQHPFGGLVLFNGQRGRNGKDAHAAPDAK